MEIVKKDLAPGITVYRAMIKDLNNTLNIVKKSMDCYTPLLNIDPEHKNEYPITGSNWNKKLNRDNYDQMLTPVMTDNLEYIKTKGFSEHEEVIMVEELNNIYKVCFTDYLKNNQNSNMLLSYIKEYEYVPSNNQWFDKDFSIHQHKKQNYLYDSNLWDEDKENHSIYGQGLILGWHFDEFTFKNIPHYRHAVTGNIYLNDDYNNGRIMFLYGNNVENFKKLDNLSIISYKPMAGDIILYPSFWPVAHAVAAPFNNDRYLISKIWKYSYIENDLDSDFMLYCENLYNDIYKYALEVPKERIKIVDGKDF